jgi:hypothetical protein
MSAASAFIRVGRYRRRRPMIEDSRYRAQARMCREQASQLGDPQAAEVWLKLAAEYDKLADAAEAAERAKPQES